MPKKTRNPNDAADRPRQLLEHESRRVIRALINKAEEGSTQALRLCVERLIPFTRERALPIRIPAAETAVDITLALNAVIAALSKGDLTAGEALKLTNIFENQRKAMETADIEERLEELEELAAKSKVRLDGNRQPRSGRQPDRAAPDIDLASLPFEPRPAKHGPNDVFDEDEEQGDEE